MVSDVKQMGQCANAGTLNVVDAVTSALAIKDGTLKELSSQQIVDCNLAEGGCSGGWVIDIWTYITTQGLETAADYPAAAGKNTCAWDTTKVAANVSGTANTVANSKASVMEAIAKQPVTLGVTANKNFIMYESGIFDSMHCGPDINHLMMAVGYGTDEASGFDYYILKNIWGTNWGEKGYMRLKAVEGEGICKSNNWGTYPTLA